MKRFLLAAAFAISVAGAADAQSIPFWGAKAPVAFETPADQLNNGQFTWAPEIAPTGPIMVLVSLDEQRAYTYRNGVLIGIASVSTGKQGFETPTGVFHTFLKDRTHRSSKYHNAAMPYTQKLTQDGVALHAGGIPGYPESHGCVHLPSEYAKLLFDAAPTGMTVVIAKAGAAPDSLIHPPFLNPLTTAGEVADDHHLAGNEAYRWEPAVAPDGPLSILVTRSDARVVVLRNGREIGRAKAVFRIPDKKLGSHVYVAKEGSREGQLFGHHWHGVAMPGHLGDDSETPDPHTISEIAISEGFRNQLAKEVRPGTTLLVTDYPVLEHTTGIDMAVFSSSPDG
ncbi:MAG: ErfK/YbiS/YcfS/YnhG family protein [Proteobacteria bacterium]|jgi:hypothetical protein|nr:ErfK/YbiS/YcfS/YnhG family protein [Pseudomonadota bacterium]